MNIRMYSIHNATSVYIHSCVKCSVLVLYCVQSGMSVSVKVYPKDIFLIRTCNAHIYECLFQQT